MSSIRTAAILTAFTLAAAGSALAQAAATRTTPSRTPHAVAGKADCLSCHGPGANENVKSVPEAHRFANAVCATCHRPAERMPPGSQHAMDPAHTRCVVCHVANNRLGAKTPPASHTAYRATVCQMCHQQAARG